jgi:hypothetical protein
MPSHSHAVRMDHDEGAARHRIINEPSPVHPRTRKGHKNVARLHRTRMSTKACSVSEHFKYEFKLHFIS